MKTHDKHLYTNYFIAAVWFINGLFCKVFNLVPRHQHIVEQILGISQGRIITITIGLLETGMAIWILSRLWSRVNAVTQISIIATMNLLEFLLVPELLLWGKANALFALLFMGVIYCNEFVLNKPAAYKV